MALARSLPSSSSQMCRGQGSVQSGQLLPQQTGENNFFMDLALYTGALSCWNKKGLSPNFPQSWKHSSAWNITSCCSVEIHQGASTKPLKTASDQKSYSVGSYWRFDTVEMLILILFPELAEIERGIIWYLCWLDLTLFWLEATTWKCSSRAQLR